jgi:hypothetical protein
MSTRWRCAVCESVNQGGETCAACGAPFTETAALATPTPPAPARDIPVPQEHERDVPVRELPVRQPDTEREIPSYEGENIYDYFDADGRNDTDDSYNPAEGFDPRPRVRVYGCCLPICLGALCLVVGAATILANLVLQAL